MSQIVTEMGQGGTMTAMMEEETATGIAMTTGTAETTIEEVSRCACLDLVLGFRSTSLYQQLFDFLIIKSIPS